MPPHPDPVGSYALTRFMAAGEAPYPPEWLDDQGRVVGARADAIEVRLKKRMGSGMLTVRLLIAEAVQLGLVRPEFA